MSYAAFMSHTCWHFVCQAEKGLGGGASGRHWTSCEALSDIAIDALSAALARNNLMTLVALHIAPLKPLNGVAGEMFINAAEVNLELRNRYGSPS